MQNRHRRQRLEIVIEIVRGIAGEHNETRAHRRCLLDIVGEYGEGILVGFAENVRGAVRYGGIVEDDVVQIILIAMGMRGAVDQADVAFGGQRAHAAQYGEKRSFHLSSPFLVKYLA